MIKLLLKKFVKDYQNTTDKVVREKYSVLSGILGIICNAVLFLVKFLIGAAMKSIAIMSDAFNNLSDMGSSVMSIISAKLSNRKPDKDHPFGHGRFEYISSLIISFLIMLVGFELLKGSFDKILSPEPISLKPWLILILALSVFIKLWMYSFNRYMGNKIDSGVLKAASADSLNDVIATSAVIVSSVIGYYLKINLDGYIGLAVSLMIMWVGFSLAKETVDVLLGGAPDKELVKSLEDLIMSGEYVLGIHDLMVHDYGPGRVFASVHAEVSDKENVSVIHEEIDVLEQKCLNELGVELVIHMDPIASDSETINSLKEMVKEVIKTRGNYSIHDFRMTDGENRINLIFDIVVPAAMTEKERKALVLEISNDIKAINEIYVCVIKVDTDYTGE